MVNDNLDSLKIIDFGYATPIDLEALACIPDIFKSKLKCTLNYMAPELYQK